MTFSFMRGGFPPSDVSGLRIRAHGIPLGGGVKFYPLFVYRRYNAEYKAPLSSNGF
jgi:hypothetical protein